MHDLAARPGHPIQVVADTNTLLRGEYRSPLVASASAGDLVVAWSGWIRDEIRAVAWRTAMDDLARRVRAGVAPEERFPVMREAIEAATDRLDERIEELDLRFRSVPDAPQIASGLLEVPDVDDRPLVAVAKRAGAIFLLSLDQRHLPHGATIAGVQCWHPDTFLPVFYTQNPDAYLRAIELIRTFPETITRRILP